MEITDLPDFIPLIERNIKENSKVLRGKAVARTLNWGEDTEKPEEHPDFILFADCIYYEQVRVILLH